MVAQIGWLSAAAVAAVVVERRGDAPAVRRRRRAERVEIVEETPRVILETEADKKLLRLAVDGRRVGDTEALEVRT